MPATVTSTRAYPHLVEHSWEDFPRVFRDAAEFSNTGCRASAANQASLVELTEIECSWCFTHRSASSQGHELSRSAAIVGTSSARIGSVKIARRRP